MTQHDICKLKSFSNEMSLGHLSYLLVEQSQEHWHLSKNRSVASGETAQAKMSLMVWSRVEDVYQLPPKTADEVQAQW